MESLLGLLGLSAVVLFWADALRAREIVFIACVRLCRQLDVQMLEESVACVGIWLARDPGGRLRVRRDYTFDFSVGGADRARGDARLVGKQLAWIRLDHPDGAIIDTPTS